jgi:hypothetical protein
MLLVGSSTFTCALCCHGRTSIAELASSSFAQLYISINVEDLYRVTSISLTAMSQRRVMARQQDSDSDDDLQAYLASLRQPSAKPASATNRTRFGCGFVSQPNYKQRFPKQRLGAVTMILAMTMRNSSAFYEGQMRHRDLLPPRARRRPASQRVKQS